MFECRAVACTLLWPFGDQHGSTGDIAVTLLQRLLLRSCTVMFQKAGFHCKQLRCRLQGRASRGTSSALNLTARPQA